jgi:hypothetical protein
MPDEGILALDNGICKLWFARNYKGALAEYRVAR